MLRRRISPLTAAMMDALAEASADTDLTGCAAVFASAHGETSVLAALLEQLTASPPALSPIAFASSVHNTASGLLSIATLNRGLSTSLAAGHDTVAAGFLEALGILHAGTTDVLVVVGDLAEPDRLVGAAERASLVAVVFHLRAAAALSPSGAHPVALVGWPMRDPSVAPSALAVSDDLARSPCAGGLSLVDAISGRVGGPVRLDGGAGDAWCINLSFPDLDVPDA